jgi:hypothetical protein
MPLCAPSLISWADKSTMQMGRVMAWKTTIWKMDVLKKLFEANIKLCLVLKTLLLSILEHLSEPGGQKKSKIHETV